MTPFQISFHGAAGEVTGSQHLIQTPGGKKILLDCGMFQGRRLVAAEKNAHFGYDPSTLDAVVISHAHIDHCGLLPKLVKEGFSGKIFGTHGTLKLVHVMLQDSAKIQEEDMRFYLQHRRAEENPLEPQKTLLYGTEDVEKVIPLLHGVDYRKPVTINDEVTVEFFDAGHVFGSSIISVKIKTADGVKKLVYTGDLGRHDMPILKDPECVGAADFLVIESTYGDRSHERVEELEEDLAEIIQRTMKRGGKVIIPAFALERTQEMILRLESLIREKKIPNVPIFIDSPLANKLSEIFTEFPEYYDEDMKDRAKKNPNVFSFENLRFIESVEASKELNHLNTPCIIMAGSGMMENGRIRHHLRNVIEDKKSALLVVGYQAEETLGRKIVDGEKVVKIFGDPYQVRLEVKIFKSLSAHADSHALDEYVKCVKGLKKIMLVHGEEKSRQAFSQRLAAMNLGAEIILPMKDEIVELE